MNLTLSWRKLSNSLRWMTKILFISYLSPSYQQLVSCYILRFATNTVTLPAVICFSIHYFHSWTPALTTLFSLMVLSKRRLLNAWLLLLSSSRVLSYQQLVTSPSLHSLLGAMIASQLLMNMHKIRKLLKKELNVLEFVRQQLPPS